MSFEQKWHNFRRNCDAAGTCQFSKNHVIATCPPRGNLPRQFVGKLHQLKKKEKKEKEEEEEKPKFQCFGSCS